MTSSTAYEGLVGSRHPWTSLYLSGTGEWHAWRDEEEKALEEGSGLPLALGAASGLLLVLRAAGRATGGIVGRAAGGGGESRRPVESRTGQRRGWRRG